LAISSSTDDPRREGDEDEGVCRSVTADLTSPGALSLISEGVDVVFHCAAIGPDAAEEDFDLGMKVNFDATRSVLTRCRRLEVRATAIVILGFGTS
jgi:nucleoside-diphosphate-sugar epimerase